MNLLLFISFGIITFVNYLIGRRNILFPSVIVAGMFTLSTLFVVLNSKWGIQIQSKTYIVLVMAVLFFSIGCAITRNKIFLMPDQKSINCGGHNYLELDIPRSFTFVLDFTCIFVSILFFVHQYSLSIELGNTNGLLGMIGVLRAASVLDSGYSNISVALNVGISFVRAAGIVYIFLAINDILNKRKNWIMTFVPILCLIFNAIIATGRSMLIMVVVTIVYDIYSIARLRQERAVNKKILKYGIILFVVFIVIFYALGNLTGQSKALNLWDTLSIYIGSPIVCIDNVIGTGWSCASPFGVHTFRGAYNIINLFGANISTESNHLEKFRWLTYSSNVYTSLHPYLLDFGIFGTMIMQFLLGFINGAVWKKYNTNKYFSKYLLIMYGRFFGSALAYYSIAEKFCSNYIALNCIVEIICCLIIIKFFVKEKRIYESK